MGWDVIAGLILQYGIPLAEKLWTKWASGNPPTEADWAELKAAAAETSKSRMLAALARAGIDPNSEQGKALLEVG